MIFLHVFLQWQWLVEGFFRSENGWLRQCCVVDIALVFTVIVNYLCMRELTSPNAFGMDLTKDASWKRVHRVLDTLIGRYLDNG